MRLFQNSGYYPSYRNRYDILAADAVTFRERIGVFLADRYGASHMLDPIQKREEWAFFANGDDEHDQRLWAREQGLKEGVSLEDILLAQIEHHRTDVFYTLDPIRFDNSFLKRLPGSVKRTIAWRAAPSGDADFSGYDLVVCNFPSMLRRFEEKGCRTAEFFPAHDPVMDEYAANAERPVDVVFVGGYSRHHMRRAALLEAVALLASRRRIEMHLDLSRFTRLAETPVGLFPPLNKHRRPRSIRAVAKLPMFGLDLYRALSRAKIAFNGSIDMAGVDRGNMRCFESMGCGALLLSDEGRYPAGMAPGENLVTYSSASDIADVIERMLDAEDERIRMAKSGYEAISTEYSKSRQWMRFLELAQ